jgi:hypothetical protein
VLDLDLGSFRESSDYPQRLIQLTASNLKQKRNRTWRLKSVLTGSAASAVLFSGLSQTRVFSEKKLKLLQSTTWFPRHLAYLLKYDSVQGRFNGTVESCKETPASEEDDLLIVNGQKIKCLSVREGPKALPWKALGVDIVIESTGLFTEDVKAQGHIDAGAKRVIISAPAKGR